MCDLGLVVEVTYPCDENAIEAVAVPSGDEDGNAEVECKPPLVDLAALQVQQLCGNLAVA